MLFCGTGVVKGTIFVAFDIFLWSSKSREDGKKKESFPIVPRVIEIKSVRSEKGNPQKPEKAIQELVSKKEIAGRWFYGLE